MDIYAIRRANLQQLATRYPDKTTFAQAVNVDSALMYKILGGKKNIGKNIARRIETQLQLTNGSLDHPQYVQSVHTSGIIPHDHLDPQTALVELLTAASLSRENAQALLHIAQIMNEHSSLTRRLPVDNLRDHPEL